VPGGGIQKLALCQMLRHSSATHPLEDGFDIRTNPPGHRHARTTMIYTHLPGRGFHGVLNPADRLGGPKWWTLPNPSCKICSCNFQKRTCSLNNFSRRVPPIAREPQAIPLRRSAEIELNETAPR
jgi:hypothetical protein